MANFKPRIERDGSIKGTALQKTLVLKIGAEVMLTYNIDTCDGLTSGAFGKVLGFEYYKNGSLKYILVSFYNDRVGKERQKRFPDYQSHYPGKRVTPIGKYESRYNIENKFSSSTGSKATAINFPLKLS